MALSLRVGALRGPDASMHRGCTEDMNKWVVTRCAQQQRAGGAEGVATFISPAFVQPHRVCPCLVPLPS